MRSKDFAAMLMGWCAACAVWTITDHQLGWTVLNIVCFFVNLHTFVMGIRDEKANA